ncbi:hypothetical protein [Thalassiella azotivora]
MLRWASEQAASSDDATSRLGVAALAALSGSDLLQEPDQDLVDAVLDSLLEEPTDEINRAGLDVDVVETDTGSGGWAVPGGVLGGERN